MISCSDQIAKRLIVSNFPLLVEVNDLDRLLLRCHSQPFVVNIASIPARMRAKSEVSHWPATIAPRVREDNCGDQCLRICESLQRLCCDLSPDGRDTKWDLLQRRCVFDLLENPSDSTMKHFIRRELLVSRPRPPSDPKFNSPYMRNVCSSEVIAYGKLKISRRRAIRVRAT